MYKIVEVSTLLYKRPNPARILDLIVGMLFTDIPSAESIYMRIFQLVELLRLRIGAYVF